MPAFLRKLWGDEQGPTAVEYGLMVALIAIVVVVGASFLGTQANLKFQAVGDTIQNAGG